MKCILKALFTLILGLLVIGLCLVVFPNCYEGSIQNHKLILKCKIKCKSEDYMVGKTHNTDYFYIIDGKKYKADLFYSQINSLIRTRHNNELSTYFDVIVDVSTDQVLAVSIHNLEN